MPRTLRKSSKCSASRRPAKARSNALRQPSQRDVSMSDSIVAWHATTFARSPPKSSRQACVRPGLSERALLDEPRSRRFLHEFGDVPLFQNTDCQRSAWTYYLVANRGPHTVGLVRHAE